MRERTAHPSAGTVVRADAGSRRLEFCVVRIHAWSYLQRWTADRASIVSKRNNQCMAGRSTAPGCLSKVGYSRRLLVHVPPHTLPWHVTLVMARSCLPSPFQEGGQISSVHTRKGRATWHVRSASNLWRIACSADPTAPWREGEARGTRHQPITYLQTCTHHNTMAMQMTVVIK